ncbi:putative MFS family arabinose efflux permease [Pedobacter psychrotolerans]|uniref:Putative MFS family arabinose efflux permease n=1 Tax=Pedobacter psychrotolerans TaxID=1843235 RepID=A0A4R2HC47_9SPHI|nr:MFS transporter [Pedobacter psychrotolerans]TCO25276.1 putative MFS family arabinose efflux permease [Pedobacter psychrotolerans]
MNSKKNLYVLALGVFGITTTEFGVIGVLPDLAKAFHVSIEKAGWLLSAFALIVAVFGPLMVSISSSINRKKLLLFSLLLFFICNVLSGLANNFYQLLVVRMLPAFFHPVYWSIALSIAEKNSDSEDKSKAVGIIFSGLTIATVLGVPIATFISGLINWQWSFFITGFINVIALIGLQIFLPTTDDKIPSVRYLKKKVLNNRLLWVNILLAFFIITAMYSTYGYMADFLKSVALMDNDKTSLMFFLFGLVGVIGNNLASNLMGKYPYGTTLSFIILLGSIHVLLNIFGGAFIPVILLISFWGLVHSGGFLISNINITSSTSDSPEFINSIFTSCGNFAVTAGTLLGGQVIASYGIQNVVWASVGCLIISFVILIIKKILFK